MFIAKSQGGYDRHGEQYARGSFLILFSHNSFMWEENNNKPHVELSGQEFVVKQGDGFVVKQTCTCAGSTHPWIGDKPVPYYYLKYCKVHSHEYKSMPAELTRKLYACVRHVSLRQMGPCMMGTARIAGRSLTLSGAYGHDGLTCDYEKLSPAGQNKLVEVPTELAEKFLKSTGHNDAGSEAGAMRQWAIATFHGGK